jgi:hypothetical protein
MQMEIVTTRIAVTTTGSVGSATGSTTSDVLRGYLLDVHLDFHASAPATTDTTLAYATRGGNILVVTNSATDALLQPLKQSCDAAAAAITGVYNSYVLDDKVTVSLAGCDALTNAVVATIRTLRL